MNKEGVDKCFLMEFVHVMGKRVHALGDFGDPGRGWEGAGGGSRRHSSCAADRNLDRISYEIDGMWPGSGRPEPDMQVTRTFGTMAGTPANSLPWPPVACQHLVLGNIWGVGPGTPLPHTAMVFTYCLDEMGVILSTADCGRQSAKHFIVKTTLRGRNKPILQMGKLRHRVG